MAYNRTDTLSGVVNISEKYELSAESDLLEINDATITLVVPGDIFTNEGDDVVFVSDSQLTGEEGTSFFLGSGNDTMTVERSTFNVDFLAGSGNDAVYIGENTTISKSFSLGSGDDILEITGTIQGDGNINFAAGNDTLKLDGGTLQTTGAVSNINNLEVSSRGGTIYQNLVFAGEANGLYLAGNLTGDVDTRKLIFDNSTITLTVAGNVVTNVGWNIANSTLVQEPIVTGASLAFSNCQEGAIYAENAQLTLQNVRFQNNKPLNYSSITGSTTSVCRGTYNDYYYTTYFGYISACGGAVYLGQNAIANFKDASFSGNSATALAQYYTQYSNRHETSTYYIPSDVNGGGVYLNSGASANFTTASFVNNLANGKGGAVYLNSGASANFTSAAFSGNMVNSVYAPVYAQGGALYLASRASANIVSNAFLGNRAGCGGAVYLDSGAIAKAASATFSGNIASGAFSSRAQGGAIYLNSGAFVDLTRAVFSKNTATAGGVLDAQGGAVYMNSGAAANFTDAVFSCNSAYYSSNGYRAQGGAVYLASGASANFSNASFSGNSAAYGGAVYLASGASANFNSVMFSGNNAWSVGGALYLDSGAYANFTNAVFTDNRGSKNGGAIFAGTAATVNYNVLDQHISNRGNNSFLYASSSDITFNISGNGSLTIGTAGQNTDSITGTGSITKNGVGVMTIHSNIDNGTSTLQWRISQGELRLLSIARTISLDAWTIKPGAMLVLSEYDDSVTLAGSKNIEGVLDLGGGSDRLMVGALSGGEVRFQTLTVSGGGTISSRMVLRNANEAMTLTLQGVTLDGELYGGMVGDTITVTGNSAINGMVNLGDGANTITATAALSFGSSVIAGSGNDTITLKSDGSFGGDIDLGGGKNYIRLNGASELSGEVLLTAGGTTEIEVFRNASLSSNVVTARFNPNSELTGIEFEWGDIPDIDKVRLLVSDNPSFNTYEFSIGLYNQSKSFTIYTERTNFLQFQVQDEDGWKQYLLPDHTAPDKVTGLTVNCDKQQVLLNWNATHDNLGGNGVWQYRVQIATDSAFGTVVREETVQALECLMELETGDYFVRVQAEDYTGNVGEWSTSKAFDIDFTPPAVPTVQASETKPTNQNVIVSACFSEDSVQKQYSLDGTSWQNYAGGIEFAQNGIIYFRAIDDHQNISEIASYNVTNIDKVAPTKPMATASTTAPTNQDVTVTATFSSDTATKQYSLDNSTWQDYTSGIVMQENGTVWFRCIDAAGNISEVTSYEVTNIDKVAPTKPTATASTTALTNQDVTVTAAFSSDTAIKQYSTDNNTWKSYTSGVVMSANGTVYFRGIDAAGNISEVTSYAVTNIDKTAPNKPMAIASTTAPTNQSVTVSATFSSDTATKQYSTDSNTWKSYTSGVVMSANGTVYFRGIDAAGNISQVTSYAVTNIDKTAPTKPTATASTTSPTNQNVTVTATFSSDTATRQYSLDNQNWQSYTSGVVMSENGTVWFRGIDAAGNISQVTSYSVTNIDKVAPAKPTATASITALTNQNVIVTAIFSGDTASKQYSIDNSTWQSYTSGVVMSTNGTVYFRGIDAAGNISEVTSYAVTNIDKTAPNKPTATASTTAPTNQNVTVSATFSSDTATKQYSTDSNTWKSYTSGVVMSANGTIYFRGIDAAGNSSEVTSYAVTNIDKTAPTKPTATASTTSPTNQNVTVSATFSSDSTTKQYSLDNQSWQSYTSGIVMQENGTVWFRGIDAAGNISQVTSYSVTNIDKTPPTKPIATASITALTNQDVTVTAAFSNDSATKQYSLDNKTWASYATGIVMSANGTVWFRGIDAAGNVSEVTSYAVTNIDKVAPNKPTATASTTSPTNQNVTVSATFSSDTTTKQYSTDNNTWKNYTSGVVMSANGTVYFRGIDAAGNISEVTSYAVNNIDKTAPTKPTATASTTSPTNQNVTVTATFSSDSATKQYSMDNQTWSAYTKGISMSENGTVYFRGIDAAGNISQVASYNVANIDKTAPASITGLGAQTTKNTVAFTWNTTTDNLAGVAQYEFQLSDKADFSHLVSTKSGATLTSHSVSLTENGTYHYRVRAKDSVGNVGEWTTASIAFEFSDDTPPTLPGNLSFTQNGTKITFSWKASTDADSGVAGYELTTVRNGRTETVTATESTSATLTLGEGDYAWSVVAKDNFDNKTEAVAGEAFRVLLPVVEPDPFELLDTPSNAVVVGTTGADLFNLTPNGEWGTLHVARWNGDASASAKLAGRNRYYDALNGAGGYDTVQLAAGDNGLVYSDLLTPSASNADAAARLAGIAEIRGNSGSDLIDMTAAEGSYAGDLLLKGGGGDDHLWAGTGDDILIGGSGDDDLRGGAGDDTYLFGDDWGRDTVVDDGGTLVFDSSLEGQLAFSATGDGTRITFGDNAVELNWNVAAGDVRYADVAALTEFRRDTIKGFLA